MKLRHGIDRKTITIRVLPPALFRRLKTKFEEIELMRRFKDSKEDFDKGKHEEMKDKRKKIATAKQEYTECHDEKQKKRELKLATKRFGQFLAKHKERIEFAGVALAADIPSYLLCVYYPKYIWIPGTIAIYGLAMNYPKILKQLKENVDPLRQKKRESFAKGEFGAGIPAVLAQYATLSLVSHESLDNHIAAVCTSWFTGRAVGVPTWIYLWKKDNKELYASTGWINDSIVKSFANGLKRKFSEVREGAINEIIEQWAYGRTIDWWFLVLKPITMMGVLLCGYRGKNAFGIYGVINDILNEIYYGFYFTPRFYPEMTERLLNKEK